MTPPVSSNAPDPGRIERQLKLFKFLALTLLIVLLVGAGSVWYGLRVNQPVQIVIDGQAVATARNAHVANDLLSQAQLSKVPASYTTDDIVRLQQVRLVHPPGPISLDTDDDALQKISSALHVHVRAYMILVDGHPSIALPTQSAAIDTIEAVKDHYANLSDEGEIVGDPEMISNVKVTRIAVSPDRLRSSPKDAASYFWTPPSPVLYTVHAGDRGMSIAHKNHISYTDLIIANPQADLNRLRVGDQLNVRRMPLLLKVALKRQVTVEEPILQHVPASEAGKRRVTYTVSYINGQEVRRDATAMTTLVKPPIRTEIM
jgi:hypothetical protein